MSEINTANQQDLTYTELSKANPTRKGFLYRYKVINHYSTLKEVLYAPNRATLLLLEDEQVVPGLFSTVHDSQVAMTVSSNQNPGRSKIKDNRAITFIQEELFDTDYNSSFYIYSEMPIKKGIIEHAVPIYFGAIGTSHLPEHQKRIFGDKDSPNSKNKVSNIITLSNIRIGNHAKNSRILCLHEDGIRYIDATKTITLWLDGMLGEFETISNDTKGSLKQQEYIFEDKNNKYAFMQALPIKVHPNLTLEVDTFDKYKNLRFDIARKFVNGGKLINLFVGKARPNKGNYPTAKMAKELYHAFSTILNLGRLSKTMYKEIREERFEKDGKTPNINFGKVFTPGDVYGIDLINLDSDGLRETTALILKTWEEKNPTYIDDEDYVDTYHNLKIALAYLGAYIPSEFSYGMNDRINNIAFNFSFTLEKAISGFDDKDIQLKLRSEKYKIDPKTQEVVSLSKEMSRLSNNKTFDIGRMISLPQPPEQFIESIKNTQPGTTDISNVTSILGYHWYFELKDKDKYRKLFGYEPNKNANTTSYDVNVEIPKLFKGLSNIGDNVTDTAELETYITNELLRDGFEIKKGFSATYIKKTNEKHWDTHERQWISCTDPQASGAQCIGSSGSGPSGYYVSSTTHHTKAASYTIRIKYVGVPIKTVVVRKIDNPYMLNVATWNDFKNKVGLDISEFVMKPERTFGKNNAVQQLTDIAFKTTMSTKASIKVSFIYEDGTTKDRTISWMLGFVDDQTVVQEGLRL